jgi:hypothetical protein
VKQNSNTQSKQKLPKGCAIALLVVCIPLMLFAVLVIAALSDGEKTEPADETVETVTSAEIEQDEPEQESPIIDDDCITASVLNIYDMDSVEGVFYLQFDIANNANREILVVMTDVYVNDIAASAYNAVPTMIQPGKRSQNPFVVPGNLSDVETIEFCFSVYDNETMELIEETEALGITP